tara:strand:- start:1678 stop:2610 length:933 start_codon:yes stop_codon:yes gene_type:complete
MINKSVLIIGSGGFLGKNIVQNFNRINYSNFVEIKGKNDLDIANYSKLNSFLENNSFDFVINCSAFVGGISFGYKFPAELLDLNTVFANNIYKACNANNIKFLVNPISNCAYPENITHYKEENFWDGPPHESVFNYGLAKRHMVALGESYFKQYGFSSANVVLSNMYGPHDHFEESRSHALGALVKKICDAKNNKTDEVELWGTGKPIREWLFVSDGARALINSLNLKKNNYFFNIGEGKGTSITELANKIASYAGWDGKFIYNYNMPDGVMEKTVDGSMGSKLLNWQPSVSLDEGIKITVDWYLEHGNQ